MLFTYINNINLLFPRSVRSSYLINEFIENEAAAFTPAGTGEHHGLVKKILFMCQ